MNSERSKFRQQEELGHLQKQAVKEGVEFATAEDLIRHDASQTPVPPEIAQRLNESIAREPKPAKSWWQKIFSTGKD